MMELLPLSQIQSPKTRNSQTPPDQLPGPPPQSQSSAGMFPSPPSNSPSYTETLSSPIDKSPSQIQGQKKTWVSRPLVRLCGVCSSPATDVLHYGATACYSCRAFFRRSAVKRREYRHCSKLTGNCQINSVATRKNCKKCRLEKCIHIGMKPEKVGRNYNANLKVTQIKPTNVNEKGKDQIDIGSLVDECFFEDGNHENVNEKKLLSPIVFGSEISQLLSVERSPTFRITFEEEFRIHELIVRKERLFEGIYNTYFEVPNFVNVWERFLLEIKNGCPVIKSAFHPRMKSVVFNNFLNGGLVRHALEMFDEFKHVPEDIKTETIDFSLSVFHICKRSYMRANRNQPTLIAQHIAAGTYNKGFQAAYDKVFPHDRQVSMVGIA